MPIHLTGVFNRHGPHHFELPNQVYLYEVALYKVGPHLQTWHAWFPMDEYFPNEEKLLEHMHDEMAKPLGERHACFLSRYLVDMGCNGLWYSFVAPVNEEDTDTLFSIPRRAITGRWMTKVMNLDFYLVERAMHKVLEQEGRRPMRELLVLLRREGQKRLTDNESNADLTTWLESRIDGTATTSDLLVICAARQARVAHMSSLARAERRGLGNAYVPNSPIVNLHRYRAARPSDGTLVQHSKEVSAIMVHELRAPRPNAGALVQLTDQMTTDMINRPAGPNEARLIQANNGSIDARINQAITQTAPSQGGPIQANSASTDARIYRESTQTAPSQGGPSQANNGSTGSSVNQESTQTAPSQGGLTQANSPSTGSSVNQESTQTAPSQGGLTQANSPSTDARVNQETPQTSPSEGGPVQGNDDNTEIRIKEEQNREDVSRIRNE